MSATEGFSACVSDRDGSFFVCVSDGGSGFSVCVGDTDRSFPFASVSVTEVFSACVSDGRLFCLCQRRKAFLLEGFSVRDGRLSVCE